MLRKETDVVWVSILTSLPLITIVGKSYNIKVCCKMFVLSGLSFVSKLFNDMCRVCLQN